MSTRERWPRWVYAGGTEPDARFSFANERTFLAWIRTALALMAAGVALDAFELSISEQIQHGLAVLFVLLGLFCALASWIRWARAERAMRHREALPSSNYSALMAAGVALAAVVLVVIGF